jgi:hypothetical protein
VIVQSVPGHTTAVKYSYVDGAGKPSTELTTVTPGVSGVDGGSTAIVVPATVASSTVAEATTARSIAAKREE